MSRGRILVALLLAPLLGAAFVVFLPLLGYVLLLGALLESLHARFRH